MSTVVTEPAPSADVAQSADAPAPVARNRWRIATTIGCHAVIDFFSFTLIPIVSVLEGHIGLTAVQGATFLSVGAISSGVAQPIVAWASDRLNTRAIGTLGFLMAVLAVGMVGFVDTYPQLLVLQFFAAAGIGAFHPTAAASVGHLAGRHRSGAISVFFCAGMLGGMFGNLVVPNYIKGIANANAVDGVPNTALGLQSIAWFIIPGAIAAFLLMRAIHSVPHRDDNAHASHSALPRAERRSRWFGVWALYASNVLRFIVDMSLVMLLARWTEELAMAKAGATELSEGLRLQASAMNGPLQAAKQLGMGGLGLLLGWFLPRHLERRALWIIPMIGCITFVILPFTGTMLAGWLALGVCVLCGASFGAVIPITISLAQRLIPHRTSLAAGLMMGGAWAFGGLGPLLGQGLYKAFGIEVAFACVAGIVFMAGAITIVISRAGSATSNLTSH